MSTAYIAAGEIKDILSDRAHILLFREDQEDSVCFLVFFKYFTIVGVYTFFASGNKNQLTCIFLFLSRSVFFFPILY